MTREATTQVILFLYIKQARQGKTCKWQCAEMQHEFTTDSMAWKLTFCHLSPLTVFSRRFLAPLPALLPTTHTTKQFLTWECCWAWVAEHEAISLIWCCSWSSYSTYYASAMARSQLQCQGTCSAEDTWVSTTTVYCWIFLLCLLFLGICIVDNRRKKRKWGFKLSKWSRARVSHLYKDFQVTKSGYWPVVKTGTTKSV